MATYQQWSQSYFTNLTPDQHNGNNNWFQSMRDRLTDKVKQNYQNITKVMDKVEQLFEEVNNND